MRIVAIAVAAALALGGCAQLREAARSAGQQIQGEAAPASAESLLAWFGQLRRLPAGELAREREAARRALAVESTDERRMRYAIALSVSTDGSVDTGRALELVEPVARRRDSPYQALAITMRSLLSDLAQAQRDRAELQRDRADLQRKLDSLKALEKSLSDREGGTK